MTDEQRIEEFKHRIAEGHKVEATDWMPDEYRSRVTRFIEMHANSEIMGALPERDWILRAPSLHRKLAVTAKIQDEVGHAQLLYRLVEDLGKSREQIFADLISGKSKYHNVFHYPTRSWGDVGIIAWLVDAAAVISQAALQKSSYAPYARTMRRICWEEAFHLKHGEDIVLTAMMGTPTQRELIQEALNRWWEPLMMFYGPPTPAEQDKDLAWGIKSRPNEELRQEFLTKYVRRIREIGLEIPDPMLRFDEESDQWEYSPIDWDKLVAISRGNGPASKERLGFRRLSYEETDWVRRSVLGAAPVAA
jgi:ring-1,2-phenylacetyl-CoA epoxidase subunit PaaA